MCVRGWVSEVEWLVRGGRVGVGVGVSVGADVGVCACIQAHMWVGRGRGGDSVSDLVQPSLALAHRNTTASTDNKALW